MSGLEVVAAVAAVVSAFHGGAELLKHIKAKRRQARQARQEFEEDQLQDSLETGEKQISHHYDQDMRQYGEIMRVGDAIAHERLQLITIMMQGEVIKSLQLAAQYETAVLNLTLLHEASIMNRKDTIITLDQLKQRLLIRMPLNRQLEGPRDSSPFEFFTSARPYRASVPMDPAHSVPTNLVAGPSITMDQHATMQSRSEAAPAFSQYDQAFRRAMDARGISDPRAMSEEIDEIMEAYQGLQIAEPQGDRWQTDQYRARENPQVMLNGPFHPSPGPSNLNYIQVPNKLSPTPEEPSSRERAHQPTFNQDISGQQQEQYAHHQQQAQCPQFHLHTQGHGPQFRWSTASGSSSTYSSPQSLHRNSSNSSQDSHTHHQSPPLIQSLRSMRSPSSPNDSYQHYDGLHATQSPTSPPHATADWHDTAPLSPQDTRSHHLSPSPTALHASSSIPPAAVASPSSLMYSSFSTSASPSPPHPQYSIAPDHDPDSGMQNRPQYHIWPAVVRAGPTNAQSTSSDHTVVPVPNAAPAPSPEASSPTASGRHASIAPSIASLESNSSAPLGILPGRGMRNSIRTDTVQSGPADSDKMMNGRACKANNYWGFCKGAWDIREDQKKGLALRVQPSGMYNTREVWECRSCSFKGSTFSIAHPTKKGKEVTIVDPRIQTSASGVRYKWIFLAKSHVKKKSTDLSPESNYGCIICSLEDKVSSVYGGVETLMNHIALSHVASLSDSTRRKAKCIIGRTAGPTEHDWDLNIPVFAEVEELA